MLRKILHVSYDFLPQSLWGVGVHLDILTRYLSSRKFNSMVITRNRFGLQQTSFYDRITVLRSAANWDTCLLKSPFNELESYIDFDLLMVWNTLLGKQVVRYMAKKDFMPLLVHNHTWMTWPAALYISNYFKVPIISSIHFLEKQYAYTENDPTFIDQKEILKIEKSYQERSDALIAFSQTTKDFLRRNYSCQRKVNVIPHGLDIEAIKAVQVKRNDNRIRILFVGRLVQEKGVFDLLSVARRIVKESDNIEFTLIGTGPMVDQIKKMYQDTHIVFMGRQDKEDLHAQYAASDIACFPSLTESFGLTIVEAMAFGLPVITTSGRTVPSFVEHAKTGITIPLKYEGGVATLSRDDLYKAIMQLVTNAELRKNLGARTRKYAEKYFSLERMGREYVKLYQKISKEHD